MTATSQAKAIAAELIAEAAAQSHKMANQFRGEVKTNYDGTEYKIVLVKGRVSLSVGGMKCSKAEFIGQLAYDVMKQSERIDAILQNK